jgi:hypothetical protein
MIKRIKELLSYIKSDVSPEGLDYVFPEVKNVFYLNTVGDTDFVYTRIDDDTFHVAKSLYLRKEPDFEAELSAQELLDTIKQSINDYDIKIQKVPKGYDVVLVEIEDELEEKINSSQSEAIGTKSPILFSPTLSEINKMLREAEGHSLRFLINPKTQDYYIADASEWVHPEMLRELKLSSAGYVRGGFDGKGYAWFNRASLLGKIHQEIMEFFKGTSLYNVLKPIITKIEYD